MLKVKNLPQVMFLHKDSTKLNYIFDRIRDWNNLIP